MQMENLMLYMTVISMVDKYINMDEVEKLPQEEKVLNYVTGGVQQDLGVDEIPESIRKLL